MPTPALMSAWPAHYERIHLVEVDSTNEEARRRTEAGERGPVWIQADRQTSGRGRRGRTWSAPAGNLAATLLLTTAKPMREVGQLSFVAALATSDAIVRMAPKLELKLKWPNDVLVDGKKIAGILLESASAGSGPPSWLAIGVGINLKGHPPDTEFPATSIGSLDMPVPDPHHALTELAAAFAKWYEAWSEQGFAGIREAWLSRAAGIGSRMVARLQDKEVSGTFDGIDANGALVLRETGGRVRLIGAGDVFFR